MEKAASRKGGGLCRDPLAGGFWHSLFPGASHTQDPVNSVTGARLPGNGLERDAPATEGRAWQGGLAQALFNAERPLSTTKEAGVFSGESATVTRSMVRKSLRQDFPLILQLT